MQWCIAQYSLTPTSRVALTTQMFMLRATQLLPHTRHTATEKTAHAQLASYGRHSMTFKARNASRLRLCWLPLCVSPQCTLTLLSAETKHC